MTSPEAFSAEGCASTHWDKVWLHANLATFDSEVGIGHIPQGAIAVTQGRIAWIGHGKDLSAMRWSATEILDASALWITPGLIDCHTHLVYAGNRSHEFALRQKGASYQDIARSGGGILSTVRATRAASEDALFECSLPRASALLHGGVTTVEIKSGYGLELESELKMLRVARRIGETLGVQVITTFLGAHTVPPEYENRSEAYVDLVCKQMLPRVAELKLADGVDAFCERIAFSPTQTRRIFRTAQQLGMDLHLHADQLSDAEGGMIAAEFDALSADHLEHASEQSLRRMAERGIVATLLPGAFYYLREKKPPPVGELRSHGLPMALATDCNPGTSPIASLLLAMNMGCVLFGLTPEEALQGVTKNAARALGLQDRGVLRVGSRADLAVWDIAQLEQLTTEIAMHRPVEVIVGGRSLVRNSTH